jgi:hypothetical protein
MPAINPIPIIGHVKFASHMLKLPPNSHWKQPQGDPAAPHYSDALTLQEKIAIPKVFPPYFSPQNQHVYHQDSCNDIGQKTKDFQDKMVDAVKFAHQMWKLQAKFQNLKIMAVAAIGQPGCLSGPSLESLIKMAPYSAAMVGNEAAYRDAIAKGVADCFQKWQDNVTVPGLPWYPAFAAFPGPMAPPMPNVPMPLITCISSQMTQIITPKPMSDAMTNALPQKMRDDDVTKIHVALFDAIATALALAFLIWLPSQQVMMVLGTGPIPTFAPPFVPVGPVVNGNNIPTPGHLAA